MAEIAAFIKHHRPGLPAGGEFDALVEQLRSLCEVYGFSASRLGLEWSNRVRCVCVSRTVCHRSHYHGRGNTNLSVDRVGLAAFRCYLANETKDGRPAFPRVHIRDIEPDNPGAGIEDGLVETDDLKDDIYEKESNAKLPVSFKIKPKDKSKEATNEPLDTQKFPGDPFPFKECGFPDDPVEVYKADKATCPMCTEIKLNPESCKKCGYTMCGDCCLKMWNPLEEGDRFKCPSCKVADPSNYTHNKSKEIEVGELKAKCVYEKQGCTWRNTYKDWWKHCNDCGLRQVRCRWYTHWTKQNKSLISCLHTASKADIAKHEAECSWRAEACKWCGQEMTSARIPDHCQTACPDREVECEHCKAKYPAKNTRYHNAWVCPWIKCKAGCDQMYLKTEEKEHFAKSDLFQKHAEGIPQLLGSVRQKKRKMAMDAEQEESQKGKQAKKDTESSGKEEKKEFSPFVSSSNPIYGSNLVARYGLTLEEMDGAFHDEGQIGIPFKRCPLPNCGVLLGEYTIGSTHGPNHRRRFWAHSSPTPSACDYFKWSAAARTEQKNTREYKRSQLSEQEFLNSSGWNDSGANKICPIIGCTSPGNLQRLKIETPQKLGRFYWTHPNWLAECPYFAWDDTREEEKKTEEKKEPAAMVTVATTTHQQRMPVSSTTATTTPFVLTEQDKKDWKEGPEFKWDAWDKKDWKEGTEFKWDAWAGSNAFSRPVTSLPVQRCEQCTEPQYVYRFTQGGDIDRLFQSHTPGFLVAHHFKWLGKYNPEEEEEKKTEETKEPAATPVALATTIAYQDRLRSRDLMTEYKRAQMQVPEIDSAFGLDEDGGRARTEYCPMRACRRLIWEYRTRLRRSFWTHSTRSGGCPYFAYDTEKIPPATQEEKKAENKSDAFLATCQERIRRPELMVEYKAVMMQTSEVKRSFDLDAEGTSARKKPCPMPSCLVYVQVWEYKIPPLHSHGARSFWTHASSEAKCPFWEWGVQVEGEEEKKEPAPISMPDSDDDDDEEEEEEGEHSAPESDFSDDDESNEDKKETERDKMRKYKRLQLSAEELRKSTRRYIQSKRCPLVGCTGLIYRSKVLSGSKKGHWFWTHTTISCPYFAWDQEERKEEKKEETEQEKMAKYKASQLTLSELEEAKAYTNNGERVCHFMGCTCNVLKFQVKSGTHKDRYFWAHCVVACPYFMWAVPDESDTDRECCQRGNMVQYKTSQLTAAQCAELRTRSVNGVATKVCRFQGCGGRLIKTEFTWSGPNQGLWFWTHHVNPSCSYFEWAIDEGMGTRP